jgi:formylglycine-generating enzyme required for sulfatase activity
MPDNADHPRTDITWYDAIAYCTWLSEVTGKDYTLPSEAEWEKAARGTIGWIYPWGDQWDPSRCNTSHGGFGHKTTPVGYYSPLGDSPYGCADMAGNVWVWTRSLWGTYWEIPDYGYPYNPADGREDLNAGDAVCRVLRGGYLIKTRNARCAKRLRYTPGTGGYFIGFRVVLSSGSK